MPSSSPLSLTRRGLLGGATSLALAGSAGCLRQIGFERKSAWRDPPLASDRPDGVYIPAITEGMKMYGQTTTGRYGVALMYSYPHRFWTLAGSNTQKTPVESNDDIHLMAVLWDTQTNQPLPLDSGVTITIQRDGELITQEVAYPMISQQMGLHYGSNYSLRGEGNYTADITIGGMSLRRTGSFANAFESVKTATIPFTFRTDEMYDISIGQPTDGGTSGAIDPVSMNDLPTGQAFPVSSIANHHAGTLIVDDAHLEVFVITDANTDTDADTDTDTDADIERGPESKADSPYLVVSARTPYNNIILPMMQLEATISQHDEVITAKRLTRTLDPTLGYHYGISIPALTHLSNPMSDEFTLEITTIIPPQIARHDGYETAFMNMDPVSLTFQIR